MILPISFLDTYMSDPPPFPSCQSYHDVFDYSNSYNYLKNHTVYVVFVIYLDVWSAGCVLAELLLGQPIFPGASGVDQLVEIIKVLGTPTREQIKEMNPHYTEFKFPQIKPHPWSKVKLTHVNFVV